MPDQIRTNFGSILEQFQVNFGSISYRFWSNFGSISEQFWTSFEPIVNRFWTNVGFRAISDQFWTNFWSILNSLIRALRAFRQPLSWPVGRRFVCFVLSFLCACFIGCLRDCMCCGLGAGVWSEFWDIYIYSYTQDIVESRDSGKSASWEVLGRSGVLGTSWEQGADDLISWAR